jgi:hypothetical protein
MEAQFNRPIRGTLHVHLDTGETWEAKPEDLARFNLVDRHDAYMAFDDALRQILRDAELIDGDITDAQLNAVRYLVEIAITSPDLLWHSGHEGWRSVAELERGLQVRAKLIREVSG